MLFKDITIIDENFEVREHMYVGTKDDRITCVSDKMPEEDFGEVYSGENRLLVPAFYNMHSHLPMYLMRGCAENLPLMTWLNDKIFPFEAQLNEKDMYYGCLMGIAEMLRFGIAGTNEMYIRYHEPLGRALTESGVKANFSVCCTCPDDSSFFEQQLYRDTLNAIEKYNGLDNGRIAVDFSLHAEYTNSEKITRSLAQAAAENKSSMHVHVSETRGEVEACRANHQGRTPVRYLADCGIFDVPTVAAHCVHVDAEDIAILKEYNVSVASCPKSNAKLASGICPVPELIKAGVNVAIGTDSVASNNNLNMIEEMRFFNLLQKVSKCDPTVITPAQTLYAATRAGAIAQHRYDCGFIKEGFKADLTVIDADEIAFRPNHNLLNNLVYSASGSDVVLTMADGKVLYRDGEYTTLDVERIAYECERSLERIRANFPI